MATSVSPLQAFRRGSPPLFISHAAFAEGRLWLTGLLQCDTVNTVVDEPRKPVLAAGILAEGFLHSGADHASGHVQDHCRAAS